MSDKRQGARGERQRGQGERVMGKGGFKFKEFRVEFGRKKER